MRTTKYWIGWIIALALAMGSLLTARADGPLPCYISPLSCQILGTNFTLANLQTALGISAGGGSTLIAGNGIAIITNGSIFTISATGGAGSSLTNTFDANQFTLIQGTNVHFLIGLIATNMNVRQGINLSNAVSQSWQNWTNDSWVSTNFATGFTIIGTNGQITLNGAGFIGPGTSLTALNATQLTSGSVPAARMPAFTGDITTSAGSIATTLKNTGTPGTYFQTTFDAQGRETGGANPTTFSGFGLGSALLSAANISGVIPIANLATGTPTGSKFIRDDGTLAVPAGSGSGTVTSVGLILPADLNVSGSPVTTAGNITVTWANENANVGLFGPASGAAATPSWRALVAGDLSAVTNGGTFYGINAFPLAGISNSITANDGLWLLNNTNQPALMISNVWDTGASIAPFVDWTGTWNTTGNSPTFFRMNVTNTASAGTALLLDMQLNGVSKFKVSNAGTVTTPAGLTAAGLTSSSTFAVTSGGNLIASQVGFGLQLKGGANGRLFEATFGAGGTVTVANTSVTTSTRALFGPHTSGGTQGAIASYVCTAGQIVINSTLATDTSTITVMLVESN